MIFEELSIVQTAALISIFIILAAFFIGFIRLFRGPSLPDRIVALDLITMLTVGIIVCYTMLTDQVVYLDAAVLLALITFLGTVAFARYLEKRVL